MNADSSKPHIEHGRSRKILALIGVFKLLKGTLMLAVAICALLAARRSANERLHEWASDFMVGPHREKLGALIARGVLHLDARKLVEVGIGAALYAAVFITEGVGLLLDKLWAEWVAVISTAGLIPLEVMELHKKPSVLKGITVAINVAIVIYLIVGVRRRMRDEKDKRHQPQRNVTGASTSG